MLERMLRYAKANRVDPSGVDEHWLHQMAETHGKPCSCKLCSHGRRWNGPTIAEKRAQAGETELVPA
jgi:hypothetical protein